jgi:hypothetical protein
LCSLGVRASSPDETLVDIRFHGVDLAVPLHLPLEIPPEPAALLLLTGRPALLAKLIGPGAELLRRQIVPA